MKRVLLLPLLIIAAACSSGGDQSPTQPVMKVGSYSTDTELSPVGVIPAATLHDAARNKDVAISVDYPTRGGPFPVIVFSHPYGSSNRAYEPLVSYWASNGYVVIRPAHADAGALHQPGADLAAMTAEPEQRPRRGDRRTSQSQVVAPRPNPAEQIWDNQREPEWRNRVADIELVINSLPDLERRFPELQLKVDATKIGVVGQGYGAFTAMFLAGKRTFGTPPLQLADPRVRAAEAFSPEGIAENRATTAQSWADVHIPVLFMTGTNDRGATDAEDANWRKEAFDNSPAGDKYFVLIQGAGAQTFTGMLSGYGETQLVPPTNASMYDSRRTNNRVPVPPSRRDFDIVEITSLAFWDAYLKSNSSAHDLLQPAKYNESFTAATMNGK